MNENDAAQTMERLVDRYIALWNEPDADRRRRTVSELWKEGGLYVSARDESRGHEKIAAAVGEAHEQFVGRGYVFRSSENVVGHHGTVRFNWEMVPAGGGEVEAIGFDFFVLGDDGRIVADYQYIDRPPSF